ncbi:hypothetical protein [Streptomyces sp. NPDC058157]
MLFSFLTLLPLGLAVILTAADDPDRHARHARHRSHRATRPSVARSRP